MRKVFRKISSCILALLVLLSTFSFTVEKHYCGRILVDVAVFSGAKGCGMELSQDTGKSGNDLNKKSCCKDELTFVKGQDDLKTSFDQIDFPEKLFITAFVYSYITQFDLSDEKETFTSVYDPPDLIYDFQVLHETYLI